MTRRARWCALIALLAGLVLCPAGTRAMPATPADSQHAEILRTLLAAEGDSTLDPDSVFRTVRGGDSSRANADTAHALTVAEARTKLDDILRSREFAPEHHESALDRWERRATAWLTEQLERLLGPVVRTRGVGEIFGWTVLALSAVALLAALAFALRGRFGREHEGADGPAHRREPGSAAWLARARGAAARGAFREAVHDAYWAAAHRLDEVHAAPFDRSRTHRETLRDIPREHAMRAPFEQLARRYERVWFGRESADEIAWNDTSRQLEELGCSDRSSAATASS